MSERDAFLNAIRENPDDDTVRLIFADWLDDRGDPLAELIRVQIELEPIRDQLDNPRVQELSHRESILLATHGHEWLGAAADIASEYPAFGPVFRRGLPEMVCLSLDTFLRRGAELFAACPTVREVSLYGVEGREAGLAAFGHFRNVDTLEIADPVYRMLPQGSAELCESLREARVRQLRLPELWDPPFTYPHLFNQFGIHRDWPVQIEIVQFSPQHTVMRSGSVEGLDRFAGRSVTRFVRPYESQFPLSGNIGHDFVAGRLDDGWDALFIPLDDESCAIAVFEDGVLDCIDHLRGSAASHVADRHEGFSPGLIRVREFWENEYRGLHLWPHSYIRDYLQNPFDRPPGVSDQWWNSRGGVLRRWLHEGRFVIEWDGREYTLDASGKIISS